MRIQHILWLFCHYIPSLFFCLRYLPFKQALKVPILLGERIKIGNLRRGDIMVKDPHRAQIIIGFKGTEGKGQHRTFISVHDNGKIIFRGSAIISKGTSLVVKEGSIDIGDSFFCNGDCWFFCDKIITFNQHCMLGWNINISTTDGHYIISNGNLKPKSAAINIGAHVWICSFATIGKGISIGPHSVIAQHSMVTKSFTNNHLLIGGIPAKILREGIDWKAK